MLYGEYNSEDIHSWQRKAHDPDKKKEVILLRKIFSKK